ncbi:uncharacterized protein LOC131668471 [Phymastichus coffea]|uniref:uncharacterized protein LOC131668471 n=1 Tax=Phymastichus coffea TaxID=108790 RepID=UPI00273CAD65|nr:uncharacterized protein LOC131668471 [Phymastichus coffea]
MSPSFVHATTERSEQQQQKIVRKLEAPAVVDPRSETLVLRCDYDLRGNELYSVNWYKYDKMLFRYMPSLTPKGTAFSSHPDDFAVDIAKSNGQQLTLVSQQDYRKNMKAYEGTYACEVSLESPFYADYAVANVSSAILPKSNPVLEGLAPYQLLGDQVEIVCMSAPSLPAAEISLRLNGAKVPSRSLSISKLYPIEGTPLVSTRVSHKLFISRNLFPMGKFDVQCKAIIPGVPAAPEFKTEKRVGLAANNQRLAQDWLGLFASEADRQCICLVVFAAVLLALCL